MSESLRLCFRIKFPGGDLIPGEVNVQPAWTLIRVRDEIYDRHEPKFKREGVDRSDLNLYAVSPCSFDAYSRPCSHNEAIGFEKEAKRKSDGPG